MRTSTLTLTILTLLLSAFSVVWFFYSWNGYDLVTGGRAVNFTLFKQVQIIEEEEITVITKPVTETTVPQKNEGEVKAIVPSPAPEQSVQEPSAPSFSEVTPPSSKEEDESIPTFRLHYVKEVEKNAEKICSECTDLNCNSKCAVFNDFVQKLAALQQGKDVRVTRLNLIPLDPMIWKMEMSGASSSEFSESAERVARSFDALPSYLRFKGSDHIFLCLTEEGCSEFARIFAERLSNNRGTRAILAGVNLDKDSIKWPCPLRIMDLTIEDTKSSDNLMKNVLKEGEKLIYKGSRWICADETHPVNHWDKIEEGRFVAAHYMEEFNLAICVLPKGGSTTIKMFMKRLMHINDWNTSRFIHEPHKNGLVRLDSTSFSHAKAKEVFEDPNIIKGTIVRNPAVRSISAYMDKILFSPHYGAIPGIRQLVKTQGKPPTFEQYVNLMAKGHDPTKGDRHFKYQIKFCGLETTRYDFVGDLENLHEDFIEFAESVGVWEEYGASGWGENGTKPMIDAWIYKKTRHKSIEKLWQYYNEDLLMKVYNHYKVDFDMLGYSIEDLLKTKPKNTTRL